MGLSIDQVIEHVCQHRCYTHPIFHHWAEVAPAPEVVGALFHQIQNFCASTRPGINFPTALKQHGLDSQSQLLQEIVESEANHGPELATMAGYVLNRSAKSTVCRDLYDQQRVESTLKAYSDRLLGGLPGYDPDTGLTIQAREAIAVFLRRERTDRESTLRNLGTALALEMISNRQLIPGEKHCLVDSRLYEASLEDPEMHYLLEHWGELGAEQQHEQNAYEAVASVLDDETAPFIVEGVDDFLDSLAALWDILDASLLQSGYRSAPERVAA